MHSLSRSKSSEVDVTPLMDIVFILIIFFVVTASFTKESGVELNRASSPLPIPSEEKNLVFHLSQGSRITVNGHAIDIWRAEALIQRRHTEQPDQPIAIKIDEGVPLKEFVRLFDAARTIGLPSHKIAIL